jgi:hypothetical protein
VRSGWLSVFVLVIFLAACSQSQDNENGTSPTEIAEATATIRLASTATAAITPTPMATNTLEAPIASLSVSDQVLAEEGRLNIDMVTAIDNGWITVFTDEAGEAGELLGFTNVSDGESKDISVTIDPFQATPTLHITLHVDSGEIGTFEYPGPDNPVRTGTDLVQESITVDIDITYPSVTVSDQELSEDGSLLIDNVTAAAQSWIAVHIDDEGQPGLMLGYAPVSKGEQEELTIKINRFNATPTLHALLYEDAGEPGRFDDPDVDKPVIIDGLVVQTTFQLRLPPDIFVVDQPALDGIIHVERATSNGPGWIVVYQDEEGDFGNIIGWSAVTNGLNHQVAISVTESAVTPILHLMLHEDLEDVGEFGFPRTDPLVRYQDRLPNPFSIRTDAGNFLVTRDQQLSEDNTVTIPMIVVDVDAWVVVKNNDSEEEIVGMIWLPAGFHRDVSVTVDPESVSENLLAALHLDGGFKQEFEFPDGVDFPLQRNRTAIEAPFTIIEGSHDQ